MSTPIDRARYLIRDWNSDDGQRARTPIERIPEWVDCLADALEDLIVEFDRRIDPADLDHIGEVTHRGSWSDGTHEVVVGYWSYPGDAARVAPDYVTGGNLADALRLALAEIRATKQVPVVGGEA